MVVYDGCGASHNCFSLNGQRTKVSTLEQKLQSVLDRGRVLTSPAQLAGYNADGLGYKTFPPDAVVLPANADELIRVLQSADQIDAPICMRGAGTSLSGGPVAAQGGVVVHTSQLRNVNKINAEGYWCEVECGVTLNQLDKALEPFGLFYPPDPSSGPVCTIGGNIAMNAGGAHCFRYGVTSNYILGIEAVLSNGSVHRFGGPAGGRGPWREDWKRLMVGSEGTLAAFTRFWLKVIPRPEKVWTFRATYPDLITAERAVHALVRHSSFPVAIELMDPRCVSMIENSPMAVGLPHDSFMIVTEIDGPADLVDARVESVAEILRQAGSSDVEYSDQDTPRKKLWKARKVAGGLVGQLSPDFLVQDAVIPKRALAELLQLVYDEGDAAGLKAMNVFHAGDGNLHPNYLFDSRIPGQLESVEEISKRLMQRVVEVGGTLSGEHGIGNDKSAYMPLVFSEETLRLQLTVPSIFSPNHQLNPLKVFTSRQYTEGNGKQPTDVDKFTAAPMEDDRDPRCFGEIMDSVDGIMSIPASATAKDIREKASEHELRFPFILDEDATLVDQVRSSGYAPASSRFGPLCDNIVGMNWELPNGNTVRLGEQVVKSTTGYDLFRFLLAGDARYGEPTDFILRLRVNTGITCVSRLAGDVGSISKAVPALLKSCWIHWFDSVDVIFEGSESCLRLVFNCPKDEWAVASRFLQSFAESHELSLDDDLDTNAPMDGLPDVVLKTTPMHVVQLAQDITMDGYRAIGLCAPGVVLGYLPSSIESSERDELIETIIYRHQDALHKQGGDWHSRHLPAYEASIHEQRWIDILKQATHNQA